MSIYTFRIVRLEDSPYFMITCPDCWGTTILPDGYPDRPYWCPWCGKKMESRILPQLPDPSAEDPDA